VKLLVQLVQILDGLQFRTKIRVRRSQSERFPKVVNRYRRPVAPERQYGPIPPEPGMIRVVLDFEIIENAGGTELTQFHELLRPFQAVNIEVRPDTC